MKSRAVVAGRAFRWLNNRHRKSIMLKKIYNSPQTASIGTLAAIFELGRYIIPKGDHSVLYRIIIAFSFIALARASMLSVPIFYGKLVDHVNGGGESVGFDLSVMWWLLGGYGLMRVGQSIFDEGSEFVFVKVAQKAVHGAALKTFRHLHQLSLRFHLDRQTGGMTRAIERGAKGMEFLLTFATLRIMPLLLELIFVSAIMWSLFGFLYAITTFATVIIYATYTLLITEWRIKFRRRMNEADEKTATRAVDSILNYETVKYFNAEEIEAKKYSEALSGYEKAAVQSRTSLSLVNIGQGLIIATGLVLVMGMAGHDINKGNFSIGSFVVVNTYLIQLYLPLNFLGYIYREIRQSLADMERMFSYLEESADIKDVEDAEPLEIKGGGIVFDNVNFSFGMRHILKDLSFRVGAGERVALVGPSGAGKSTIARLMFRFYDPESGAVLIDGQDLRDVEQSSVRAAIAVVPQDTVLFNATIADNIAYGNPEANLHDVRDAAKLASLHEFIKNFPDGYETEVGERGLKLSGGEKQRVAIARAIIKRPSIFLFDEATSALDTRTEKEIQYSLDKISEGLTTLVIAHRLSTVVNCDKIIVLNEGRVAEEGTHQDLLALKGMYYTMWMRQAEDKEKLIDDH